MKDSRIEKQSLMKCRNYIVYRQIFVYIHYSLIFCPFQDHHNFLIIILCCVYKFFFCLSIFIAFVCYSQFRFFSVFDYLIHYFIIFRDLLFSFLSSIMYGINHFFVLFRVLINFFQQIMEIIFSKDDIQEISFLHC